MPYIKTQDVAAIRAELKTAFPEIKFSVRLNDCHSGIHVSIMASPYDWGKPSQQLNEFYPEQCAYPALFRRIIAVTEKTNNRKVHYDGDYGWIPKFYVDYEIGRWDKPHVFRAK